MIATRKRTGYVSVGEKLVSNQFACSSCPDFVFLQRKLLACAQNSIQSSQTNSLRYKLAHDLVIDSFGSLAAITIALLGAEQFVSDLRPLESNGAANGTSFSNPAVQTRLSINSSNARWSSSPANAKRNANPISVIA